MLLMLSLTGQAQQFTPVAHPDFVADYYPGVKQGSFGVMVLGGAEGGKPNALAQRLAGFGYPVLSLAYFNEQGLPNELEAIPLEYFTAPRAWLAAQQATRDDAVLVAGWSKGAELALILAARQPDYAGVVAIAPSSVVWAGILKDWQKVPRSSWTLADKPLAHVPFQGGEGITTLLALYENSLKNTKAVRSARIDVTKIAAPMLLLTGGQDEVWPSNDMASQICGQLRADQCRHVNYPMAGHLLDDEHVIGGTKIANAEAKAAANSELAAFLQRINQ
jgi:uncharacterized protein